ncbi:type IV secretion system DNA-binding domain-containing protein [Candidatus Berkelbacteria bacterium]|nr:type IV secretion system DNA-binding domain-containing protein [Candidatus Berkelbacteria bacterium]
MNTEELASVYHLPASTVETPNIAWAGSKKGEPPANLPLKGKTVDDDTTFFGTTDFRNFKELFGIRKKDRRLHMYTIGKTGTGKSTLLQNMIIDDIQKGRGVGVVDPHGQLVADILERIPAHRINDVVYFNPADREFPIGFNILENVEPDLRNVVASGVVGIFKKLFAESWGPRLEYILRNAILALLYYPETTMLGVNRLLVDDEYRSRIVRKVTDPIVRDFFLEEYDKYDPKFRREAISSIQNKIGQFLSSTTIRNIIGQPKSAFDMRSAMDEGKILLMDLSIGKIGEDNAAMLGSMMITKIQLAAMSRANVQEEDRPDFYLYVDEFQNFATESFAVILSEARKYHLNLVLTNQYISQMPEEVAHAVFGNVGTIISFRVGAQDASGLVREFEPVFEAIDLVNLDNHHIYVKMAIDGVTRPAFSATTLPPMDSIGTEHIAKIVRVSRERYGRPRALVESKIQDWAADTQVKQAQEWRKRVEEHSNHTAQGTAQPVDERSSATEQGRPTMSGRGKLPKRDRRPFRLQPDSPTHPLIRTEDIASLTKPYQPPQSRSHKDAAVDELQTLDEL